MLGKLNTWLLGGLEQWKKSKGGDYSK